MRVGSRLCSQSGNRVAVFTILFYRFEFDRTVLAIREKKSLYGLFVLRATRRRTDRRFFVVLMIVLGLPAFLLFGTGSAYFLNGTMDRSAPVEISATATGLFSSGRGKKIRFMVDDRPSNPFDARGVSANPEGDTVHVQLHSGRLGIPWVSR